MFGRFRQWLDEQAELGDELRRQHLAQERRRSQAGYGGGQVDVTTSRPTVTRVGAGMLLGGLPGAILGFAWRKKQKTSIRP